MPLILGGPTIDIHSFGDASLASMEDRKSVASFALFAGINSGAIEVMCHVIKSIIKSAFECELVAIDDQLDSLLAGKQEAMELEYPELPTSRIFTDNEACIKWIEGGNPSKATRHIAIRMYRCRQHHKDNTFKYVYVSTSQNIADVLTKVLTCEQFQYLTWRLMGHALVIHLDIPGIDFKFDVPEY